MSGPDIKEKLLTKHKELIIHSLKAIKGKLNLRKSSYELVGFDFIMDENLESYLIEVNTNPCIEESSNLLKMLMPRMLDDMFKLTLDSVFNIGTLSHSQFHVEGYEDCINMWEPIYSFYWYRTS